uniref:Fibronectin type-III domain-containing protein n=1 Tax=Taenia asiatica TaxID=60517 RepID=A0A0R3VZM3_TAEAS
LTPKNHTEVTVRWEEPSDREPMDVYAAYIAGPGVKQCTADNGSVGCTISGLLPRIPYNVCVRNCHPKPVTTTTAPSSLEGARLVSSGDLFEVATIVETDKYICSNAECGSVTLTMEVNVQ